MRSKTSKFISYETTVRLKLRSGRSLESGLSESLTEIGVDLVEHAKGLILDLRSGTAEVDRDVVDEVLLLVGSLAEGLPEVAGLDVIVAGGADHPLVRGGLANPLLVLLVELNVLSVLERLERRGVVGERAVVAVDSHGTISDEGRVDVVGAVDGDLLEVGTESMSGGVGVGEESRLQNRVGRSLPAGDSVRRRESSLLGLGEVVVNVLVESELAESSQREVSVGPDLGEVKDGPLELLSLLGGADLDVTSPRGEVLLLNVLDKILLGVVGVGAAEDAGLVVGEVLDALVGLHVDLDVVERTVLLDPLVGVAGVTVHLSVVSRGTSVGEEDHDLVNALLVVGKVVPEHVGVLEVGLGVSLLGVDEDGELGGVSDEEDGGVVVDPVDVALLGVELGGETSGVSGGVGGALLATDGGESGEGLGLLANGGEEVRGDEIGDVVGHLKLSVSAGALGVHNSLRNSLSVEMSQQVDEGKVLEEKRTMLADSLRGERVLDGSSVGGGIDGDTFSRHCC